MRKIVRITTVPLSLNLFCRGLLAELSVEFDVLAVSSPGEELQQIARREHVRTAAVPMERAISPVKDFVSLLRLIRLFRRERPDIVHSMTPKAGLLAMAAACVTRVPVRVHTFTGLVFPSATGFKRHLLMLTDRLTCLCATHVVPEGYGVMDDLRRFHITRKPMQVLGHGNVRGIDLDYYTRSESVASESGRIRTELGIESGAFVFIFIGRLTSDKGINELVAAFVQLLHTHPSAHLILVGETESTDPLEPYTLSTIDAETRIHRVGWREDVRPWYAAGDALVFPSYREGFPNVVIESCAMGLPCIVTDINGSREIITEGFNGIIIPPRNVAHLYESMMWAASHREHLRVMAANARPSVASCFEQGYVRRCLMDFYHSIL